MKRQGKAVVDARLKNRHRKAIARKKAVAAKAAVYVPTLEAMGTPIHIRDFVGKEDCTEEEISYIVKNMEESGLIEIYNDHIVAIDPRAMEVFVEQLKNEIESE